MSEADGVAPDDNRREAKRWLAFVEEDIDVARAAARLNPPRLGAAAYHLQQAAEKLIKSLLVLSSKPFRRTHDLDHLVTQLAPPFPEFKDTLDSFRPLTIWSVAFRYPGIDDEPTTPPPLEEIDRLAAVILAFANRVVALADT